MSTGMACRQVKSKAVQYSTVLYGIQRETLCMGGTLCRRSITSLYVDSRVDYNTCTMGNTMTKYRL